MSIPASQIVNIQPRIIADNGNDLEFNGLVLTQNSIIPTSSPVLVFGTATDVGNFFGVDSDEYKASAVYFGGYNNSFKKPNKILFARRIDVAIPAYICGGAFDGVLSDLTSITGGDLTINIDGKDVTVNGIDFTGATSLSDVANILQTALQTQLDGVTVGYSSLTKAFTITSPSTGVTETVTYGSGSIATALNFTAESNAVLSQGFNAQTVAENMAMIVNETQNFVSFTTLYEADNTEHLACAEWASNQGADYLYVGWTGDPNLLVPGSTSSIADLIDKANYGATELVYNNINVALFLMGAIASVDWERYQGTINYAFKRADGVGATVNNALEADLLLNKGVSFMGNYATRNNAFIFFYDGKMFGDYGYVDTFINAIWLKNVLQLAIMNGLANAGRVPYTEIGYSLIRAWVQDPLNRAINNGVIDSGVSLTESQKAQIQQETGKDLTTELSTTGYAVLISDPSASVRTARKSPNISLYYAYGGSVNKIDLVSNAVI